MESKFWNNFEITNVTLRVKDLQVISKFYQTIIGLKVLDQSENSVSLGTEKKVLIKLIQGEDCSIPTQPRTGLYHTAFLVPDHQSLAQWLLHASSRYPISGASDHLVSEAIYLDDPEGNGIEIYRDRDSSEWLIADGKPQMGSERLDLNQLVSEARLLESFATLPTKSQIGHIHLRVGNIEESTTWYQNNLAMQTILDVGSAVFLSQNSYHHHIGANTWDSSGAPHLQANETGLVGFAIKGTAIPAQLIDPNGIEIAYT
jgi:catechol 2,3-dioxygenase